MTFDLSADKIVIWGFHFDFSMKAETWFKTHDQQA